jgi:hypothetical protein
MVVVGSDHRQYCSAEELKGLDLCLPSRADTGAFALVEDVSAGRIVHGHSSREQG